jgi:hypothetical protein
MTNNKPTTNLDYVNVQTTSGTSNNIPASSSQPLNLNEIERQQRELELKAAELDRREKMLNAGTNLGNIGT